jgi:hypothetical protein
MALYDATFSRENSSPCPAEGPGADLPKSAVPQTSSVVDLINNKARFEDNHVQD